MPPLVSVVIPAYNSAAFIQRTLDGVTRQTFSDYEIIVVDDGSTDATAQAVRDFDHNICYSRQENQGPAVARNRGASLAKGEFIAFCDHDDVWNPRHLETSLDTFHQFPSAAMVFADAEFCDLSGNGFGTHIVQKVKRRLAGRSVPIQQIWDCWVASMSVVVVRKQIFDELGGLHPAIWGLDDLHFYLRLAARHEVRYADFVGCKKYATSDNLLARVALEGLIRCLEDLKINHPEVVRAVGPWKFRARLTNRYRKLAARYFHSGQGALAEDMAWKAWRENRVSAHNLAALFRFARGKKPMVSHGA